MTSRDFGFTTLRSAVAYRRNNTLVPPNNVYITSTNGAAIFSDTLTISTINVSTINGGGGGGVNSVTAGTNISTSGTASNPVINVNINSTLEMNGNYIHSSGNLGISSDAILNLDGTFVNMASSDGGIVLQTNGTTRTITLDIGGLLDVQSPNVRLFGLSTLQTNKMVYIADGTGFLSVGDLPSSVSSVTAGTNISTSGTASVPIVNVAISSPLDMNGQPLIDSTGAVNINGNLVVSSSAITQQIVTSSITTTPITLNSGFFGKYTFVSTNVAATITLPSPASEGSVLIFKNLMTNAFSTITISPVYSGGTISADTAASYVFTTYANSGSWVSL
jgi:hypothetical protein